MMSGVARRDQEAPLPEGVSLLIGTHPVLGLSGFPSTLCESAGDLKLGHVTPRMEHVKRISK